MLDTTPVTTAIKELISAGVTEGQLLTRVMRAFPNLTIAERSTALRVAITAAERQAARRH